MSKLIQVIEDELSETKEKAKKYFYVGDVLKCPRALYYKWNGVEGLPYDGNTLLKFHTGDLYHQLLVNVLLGLRNVRVVASEVDMPNEKCNGLVHGRADIIVSIKGENKLRIVDIKSINGYGFKKIQDNTERKEDHILQVQFYMYFFDIDKGSLLYINKDTQELFEVEVERDDAKVECALEKFRQLKSKFENNEEPPVPDTTSWKYNKCQYCQYRTICDVAKSNI